jgi:hypothetical protein
MTKSTKSDNTQFIVHVKSEYDYTFESDFRKEIFDAIKWIFWQQHNLNLPIYGVPDKLKDYATSKKDISQGIEVNPKEEYRLQKEDGFEEKGGSKSTLASSSGSMGSPGGYDEVNQWNDEIKNSVATGMYSKHADGTSSSL